MDDYNMINYRRVFSPLHNDSEYLEVYTEPNTIRLIYASITYTEPSDPSTTDSENNDTVGNQSKDSINLDQPDVVIKYTLSTTIDTSSLALNTVYHCYFCTGKTGITIPLVKPISRGGMQALFDLHKIDSDYPIISIYITKDRTFVFIPNIPIKLPDTNTDNYIQYSDNKLSTAIIANDAQYIDKLKVLDAQRKNLVNLDPNNSLAGLEAHVDILTRVILLFMQQFPTEFEALRNKFPELTEFINIFNQTNVLVLKPITDALDTMQTEKQVVRSSLYEYYESTLNN